MSPRSRVCARWHLTVLCTALLAATTCSDPAQPESEVSSIELSVADTTIHFRDRLIVRASPQGALGVPLARPVTWTSSAPSLLALETLGANGDSARIRPAGVGTGEIRVSAGSVTRSFQVTVEDTVYSVTVAPNAISLVAGDTISFIANVAGPPNATKSVRWDVTNASVLPTFPLEDAVRLLVQVRSAGSATVRATALADTTKAASATLTAERGRLVFLTQPGTTFPRVGFSPFVQVAVHDGNGNVSARSMSTITLTPGSTTCSTGLTGTATVAAQHGVGAFSTLGVSERCDALSLVATASPEALTATSASFAVISRGCNSVVPLIPTGVVNALLEIVDCVAVRGSESYYTHRYALTVPGFGSTSAFSVFAQATGFTPRVESYLWADSPGVHWTDSLGSDGALLTGFALVSGTYRVDVTSSAPATTGPYSLTSRLVQDSARIFCTVLTKPGVSFQFEFLSPACPLAFQRRLAQLGRRAVFYLPAGKTVGVLMQNITAIPFPPVFEVYDVTTEPRLIHFDDNSSNTSNAQVAVTAAPTGRFIAIHMSFNAFGSPSGNAFRLTISP